MSLRKSVSLGCTLVYFAVVQYNDPDPQLWIPTYLLAAAACFAIFLDKAPRTYVYLLMAVGYFVAAFLQWPPQYEGVFWGEMQMRSLNIELARESLGLSIAGLGMLGMARLR
jgi:hypothetical protein